MKEFRQNTWSQATNKFSGCIVFLNKEAPQKMHGFQRNWFVISDAKHNEFLDKLFNENLDSRFYTLEPSIMQDFRKGIQQTTNPRFLIQDEFSFDSLQDEYRCFF
eukprot:Gregarina_sp_Poly_1__5629@NODE_296_length_9847_cov_43_256544_g256_i0_p11_GENE_NODE_296_length_9847_cov_43_256544_g256_i0NODE_296_length_9847_cov_43_256544_g256_i0_p11_ORF_typecomplete_len105_score11_10DegT_DnrJ_EryC1/PF01041_17/0_19_NODE_296_length_9847_cov_43_256544_g256_i029953309